MLTLWQRLAMVFSALLLACFGATVWLQTSQSTRLAQQTEQQLLRRLAMHIATDIAGSSAAGDARFQSAAEQLSTTNPGVDLYLLDDLGRVRARYPRSASLRNDMVALQPLRDLLAGQPLPILGDDPMHAGQRKIFSVALYDLPGRPNGYVYAVLHGSAHAMAAADARGGATVRNAVWAACVVVPLGLVAALVAFRLVARPLSRLTTEVQALELAAVPGQPDVVRGASAAGVAVRDEISALRSAFLNLSLSNAAQWTSLNQQDQHRREWLANISHDLRTPLASMQGYLETVLLKSVSLSDAERDQYLRTALSECRRLGRLAQELLELARLELGAVKPDFETFSLVELAQDVLQKLALSAQARQQLLVPDFAPGALEVQADIGMIERVLTNLIDNAIRHTPPGGRIRLQVAPDGEVLRIEVADHGPGIPPALRPGLFSHSMHRLPSPDGGGLGLAIVQQLLQLHGSDIRLHDGPGGGAVFTFTLPARR